MTGVFRRAWQPRPRRRVLLTAKKALLVVGDSGSLDNPQDTDIKSHLEDEGYSVDVVSDTDTEQKAGYRIIVITNTASQGSVNQKWFPDTAGDPPVLIGHNGDNTNNHWTNYGMIGAFQLGTHGSLTQVNYNDNSLATWTGESLGTVTVHDAGSSTFYALNTYPTGGVDMIQRVAASNDFVVLFPSGTNMSNGDNPGTSTNKIAQYGLMATDALNNDNGKLEQLFKDVVSWLVSTAVTPTLDQERFRFRNDEAGAEAPGTWAAAENANLTSLAKNDPHGIRILIDAAGDPAGDAYKIQWRKKTGPGAWVDLD